MKRHMDKAETAIKTAKNDTISTVNDLESAVITVSLDRIDRLVDDILGPKSAN